MGADEKQGDDRGWLVEQRYRAVLEVLDGSASSTGDVKTTKSKRSLVLPKRAVAALQAHKKR
jgi:hypothetical protein